MGEPVNSGGAERRKHARVEKHLPVWVRRDQEQYGADAEIINIGSGGVLLRTALQCSTNDLLSIDLKLPGEARPISMYGTVVRSDARGYGVSFVRISEINAELITYLIRKWRRQGVPTSA